MVAGWFGVAVTALVTSTHLCNFEPSVSSKIFDLWRVYLPDIYPCPLSLAIPSWVGAMTTGEETARSVWQRALLRGLLACYSMQP